MDDDQEPTSSKCSGSSQEFDEERLSHLFTFKPESYDDKLSFREQLEAHTHNMVWAFEYCEEVNKRTLENIRAHQMKSAALSNAETSPQTIDDTKMTEVTQDGDEATPGPSKMMVDYNTPHSNKRIVAQRKSKRKERVGKNQTVRKIPTPLLQFAECEEIWQNMINKEEATLKNRNCRLFEDRSAFMPRMRSILVDWIMEVCEVYRLRRVTYYLAVDYIDRYLTINPDVPKTQLQLVGVTSLFIAAKLEEIYPPRLKELSYVCDGACTKDEILCCELLLLNTLGWEMNPMTASGWLNLYMQIHCNIDKVRNVKLNKEMFRKFLFPQYSGYQFVRASQLMDLFSLDPGFLRFSYSVIAAGAVYFIYGKNVALNISGLSWDELRHCVEYMTVFYKVIRDNPDPRLNSVTALDDDSLKSASLRAIRKRLPGLIPDESHALQTHCVDLQTFEIATLLRLEQMGMRAEKAVIKQNKDKLARTCAFASDYACENSLPEKEETEITVPMFDIEKILDEGCVYTDEVKGEESISDVASASNGEGSDADLKPGLAFTAGRKTRVSFDDILFGLNDCTSNSSQRSHSLY